MPVLGQGMGRRERLGTQYGDAIAKLGENIVLQRSVSGVHDPVPRLRVDLGLYVASYTHGGVLPSWGCIGALALIVLKLPRLTPLLRASAIGCTRRRKRSAAVVSYWA